ncbi:DUF397 domain-containing protein [Streptomyces anulatus]|uniref:DUF397 domain-containing protein n=1 Tax=Streptomyces anulatus TaxID=1892 RepID=UPI0033E5C380
MRTCPRNEPRPPPGNNECVEVAPDLPHLVPVRDSTRPAGPAITFGHDAWRAFVGNLA